MTSQIVNFETAFVNFASWVIDISTSINEFSTSATADEATKTTPPSSLSCLGGVYDSVYILEIYKNFSTNSVGERISIFAVSVLR